MTNFGSSHTFFSSVLFVANSLDIRVWLECSIVEQHLRQHTWVSELEHNGAQKSNVNSSQRACTGDELFESTCEFVAVWRRNRGDG